MIVLEGLSGLRQLPGGSILSIGNFDGMHLGHQHLLEYARNLKKSTGAAVAVATFEPHPLTVLRPEIAPPRLTPSQRKRELLAQGGADALVVLPPSSEILGLTAEQFWQILKDEVRPAHLVEGESFFFGKDRAGTIGKLRQWTVGTGISLHIVDAMKVALLNKLLVAVSSSIVRLLLLNGRVRDAAICLGRNYEVEGTVVEGAKRGRAMGIPTANLECVDQLIPADGIYAGRCTIDGKSWPAAISIGTNPTFGDNPRTVEAHLPGFQGDLYGQSLRLEMIDWIRDQEVFPDIDSLRSRIARDVRLTEMRNREFAIG